MSTLEVPFTIGNPWGFPAYGKPLRCSVPLPAGAVNDPAAELALLDEDGRDMGAQWRVLSTWDDGSARFALMDYAEAEIAPRTTHRYTLKTRDGQSFESAEKSRIGVEEDDAMLTVDTGRLRWTFSKRRFTWAESIEFAGRDWAAGCETDLISVDMQGQVYRASEGAYSIAFEERGPYRVIVRIEGDHRNPLSKFMDYTLRLHFTAGGSQALAMHTVRNRHAGREGRDVKRLGLIGALNLGETTLRRVLHTARTVQTLQAPVEIPENVDIDVGHYQTLLRNPNSLRENSEDICWSLKNEGELGRHNQVAPMLDVHEPGAGGMLARFAMASPNQEAPMRLASDRARFEIDFYPEIDESMHLNEGMGKTRDVLLHFHDDSLQAEEVMHDSNHLSYPGVVSAGRAAYRDAGFAEVHKTLEYQPNEYPMLEMKIEHLMSEGMEKVGRKMDTYLTATGWRDYGDAVAMRGRYPEQQVAQFVNNEEDYIYVAMIDAWRKGKAFGALGPARHLMDIDYMDYSSDPSRDGAVCPHSTNHTDGEVYPSHQWCQGLLYFYLATGDAEALRISKRIGDNLVWWVTGPRSAALRYSGRETAWPLLSLASLYQITHEQRYRDAGMRIVDDLISIHEEHGSLVWEHPPGSGVYSGYMLAMSFNGIWDMWAVTGEPRVLDLWKRITQPVIDRLQAPDSLGYIHFRNAHIRFADLTTLARWYDLTGEKRYIELGRSGLRLTLSGCPQPLLQDESYAAMGYRHFIFYLKKADEFDMINDDQVTLVW